AFGSFSAVLFVARLIRVSRGNPVPALRTVLVIVFNHLSLFLVRRALLVVVAILIRVGHLRVVGIFIFIRRRIIGLVFAGAICPNALPLLTRRTSWCWPISRVRI